MENNLQVIGRMLDYIEEHLNDEELNLDMIAEQMGYSKYHLHRMFTFVVGISIHQYLQRRRLTEASRMLVFTEKTLMEIGLYAGYDTQRSFSRSFKSMYKCTPSSYRKQRNFMPVQLKYNIEKHKKIPGDMILNIKMAEEDGMLLIGYDGSTKRGFGSIGRCWKLMHKHKYEIVNRSEMDFLIGVNDYAEYESSGPVFHYIVAAQVTSLERIPAHMKAFTLPPGKYAVFSFRGKNEDSLQPAAEYIYEEWFPNSACRFNERNLYDFVKYGEETAENGRSDIQFWIPVL
ncbi:AraC family transcriptional regulator [Anaerostipes sp.]|uniref:AraC family transcriptional regulator n=1 Tax=Anaerostipes sp. TaxID=1872530 RepID=UPI0025B8A690|nr:AraC family transcriptional regulator [Anaerostipes sp.]MBS7008519.1 AraC family transcriptional regulator [Anaerostipes sp.]